MLDTYNKSFDKYNVEDGNFELYSKADDKLIDRLEEENVTIYENFYKEGTLKVHNNEKLREDDQSTIRFYINRDDIDKVDVMEGRLAEDINEIALDRMYSVNNNIKIGDIINVGTRALKVTGYVALSDYSCLFSNNSDTMFDSLKFGVGVVSESCFDMYDDTHIHYVYSWKYDNKPADDIEEKEMADDFMKVISNNAILTNYIPGYLNQTGVTSEGAGVDENGASLDFDADLKAVVTGTRDKVQNKMATLHVADAMTEVFALFKRCNKYIDETMPWALAKDESKKERLEEVLYNLVESITIGANLLKAFMPNTTESILKQLYPDNPAAGDRDFDDLDKFGLRESGSKVTDKPEILFARLDIEEVMKKVEELQEAQRKANGVPEYPVVEKKPEITFDDFEKIQIQVGEVLKCEPVKKAKKLLCSQIRVGEEVRQIVSGIWLARR